MAPRRLSSRTQQPAQRRPRTERACNFCRIARQRCEPTEYGINDRPCRRCVSQGLDCNLPRTARSQSPSSTFGAQGPAPIQHHTTLHSAGGAAEELTPGSETTLQYILPRSESVGAPMMRGWPPPVIFSEGEQGPGTTGLESGQATLQIPSYLPRTSSMEGFQQSFSNATEVSTDPDYYPEDYYHDGQTASSHTYMADYATRIEAGGEPNLGYAMEGSQLHPTCSFAGEQDAPCSVDQPHNADVFSDEQESSLPRPDES